VAADGETVITPLVVLPSLRGNGEETDVRRTAVESGASAWSVPFSVVADAATVEWVETRWSAMSRAEASVAVARKALIDVAASARHRAVRVCFARGGWDMR
jgi:hypothetical protein